MLGRRVLATGVKFTGVRGTLVNNAGRWADDTVYTTTLPLPSIYWGKRYTGYWIKVLDQRYWIRGYKSEGH